VIVGRWVGVDGAKSARSTGPVVLLLRLRLIESLPAGGQMHWREREQSPRDRCTVPDRIEVTMTLQTAPAHLALLDLTFSARRRTLIALDFPSPTGEASSP
jgi:hypothetical protein